MILHLFSSKMPKHPLLLYFVITKLHTCLSGWLLFYLSPLETHMHTDTFTNSRQWDSEGKGDHLSQSAVMIVYQRMEEWSGSRWWKQAL